MRTFQKRPEESPSAIPVKQVDSLFRDTMRKPAKYAGPGGEVTSLCVNCDAKPCLKFSATEVPADAPPHARRVCPTEAIHYSDLERVVVVTDACIGCSLCVLRCPYGAIFVDGNKANTLPFDAATFKTAPVEETEKLLKLMTTVTIPAAEIRSIVQKSIAGQLSTDKGVFYPLAGSLLTSIGLYTVVSRAGDTSNRMDAVVRDPVESIPAEIKAPRETGYVNVKAVRQAVENKIVMTARKMHPTKPETSTLAIGYLYPNERSDVDELVEDIAATFGINVGLISLEALYAMVWKRYVRGDKTAEATIRRLRGRANANIS